jgi:hypothetical protein
MRLTGALVPCLRKSGAGFLTKASCTMELRQYWPKTPGDVRQTGAAVTTPLTGARADLRRWEKQR